MTLVELKTLNKASKNSNSTDHDEHGQVSKPSSYLIAVACTCALTAFHFGYAISSINGPSVLFRDCKSSGNTFLGLQGCFHVESAAWGLVGMGLPLGGWIGGSLAPTLSSKLGGIKPAILSLNVILAIAYLFMSLAVNLSMLIIGRILIGFASGASGMLVPLYLSSISPLPFRSLFTNFFQLFLCSAAFIAEIISFSASLSTSLWYWRFSFAFGLLVIALQLFLTNFCNSFPESPLDLDAKDPAEAKTLRIRFGHILDDPEKQQQESNNVQSENISNNTELPTGSFWDLITFKIHLARKSLLLGILLQAGQQLSGVNAVFFYSKFIIEGSESTPVFLTFINLVMTLVAIWLLDRLGRRPVALFSVAGSALSLIALALSFSLFPVSSPLFLITFIACFAVGLGPIPWMLVPEIFPTNWSLTQTAISICVTANWIPNIIVSGAFPLLTQILPMNAIFWIFGISCSLLFLCLHQFLPETKNRIANFI